MRMSEQRASRCINYTSNNELFLLQLLFSGGSVFHAGCIKVRGDILPRIEGLRIHH